VRKKFYNKSKQVAQIIFKKKLRNLVSRTSYAIYFQEQATQFIFKSKPRNLFSSTNRKIYFQSQARQY